MHSSFLDLQDKWGYIEKVAKERLANNRTSRHVSQYGEQIEVLGAAGELAARRFLKLPEDLHIHFDHGVDIEYHGHSIDVKATHLTKRIQYRFLQWPHWKQVKADIIIMTAVDLKNKHAEVLGYATKEEVLAAPINKERDTPCHEIPIPELKDVYDL